MAGANIGPLAEVRLAQNNGSRGTQFFGDERISCWPGSEQGKRAGGSHHFVGGVDVVFDKDGYAVQRSTRTFGFALLIESCGDGESVGIELNHTVDRGTAFIDFVDSVRVFFYEGACGE